jgi:hypothetical protein
MINDLSRAVFRALRVLRSQWSKAGYHPTCECMHPDCRTGPFHRLYRIILNCYVISKLTFRLGERAGFFNGHIHLEAGVQDHHAPPVGFTADQTSDALA